MFEVAITNKPDTPMTDSSTVNSHTVDISGMCADVITILDHAAAQQQRLTAIKLIDTWQGKGTKPMKGSGASVTTASREECELILAIMLLKDYIKEDFHFTPYATISYLVPGIVQIVSLIL